MVTITEAAVAHLLQMLSDAEAPDEVAVRFTHGDKGFSLKLDETRPGDVALDHGGRTVLVLDEKTSELLDGRRVDVQKTADGVKLALN